MEAPPVLSTPADNFYNDRHAPGYKALRSDDLIHVAYEIDRTAAEIMEGGWKTVALQFPDDMLPEAPRVFDALSIRLCPPKTQNRHESSPTDLTENRNGQSIISRKKSEVKLYILADTSYGSCCVDELAAEHVEADVVVHYGRACLSPTARLPVIHIFTVQPLAIDPLLQAFKDTFPSRAERIILMADVSYSSHLRHISEMLHRSGYRNLFTTSIVHNPSSPLPNRTSPDEVKMDAAKLKDWHLFHISTPPNSLMLILSSRVSSMYIFPVTNSTSPLSTKSIRAYTVSALRRRYALLISVSTVSVFGILINTLSVKNYLYIVEHVKAQIRNAGKKSYMFVVGKINAAKVANFSEIGAWVIIGCWECSLIDSEDFWKPILTPFELELALMKDSERIWTGEWRSDFQSILDETPKNSNESKTDATFPDRNFHHSENALGDEEDDGELESMPPEFDLRTGRYVSDTRPRQFLAKPESVVDGNEQTFPARPLVKRFKSDLAVIGGELSSGAEYLRANRTWRGLGSDFEIKYDELDHAESTLVEEGRTGIARGLQSIGRFGGLEAQKREQKSRSLVPDLRLEAAVWPELCDQYSESVLPNYRLPCSESVSLHSSFVKGAANRNGNTAVKTLKQGLIIAHQCDYPSWVVRGKDDLPMDGVALPPSHERIGFKTRCSTRPATIVEGFANTNLPQVRTCLSTLELIVATHPPVLESLLLQLPTASIISLYHTSRFLQSFLRSYPLAWTHISFRLSTAGRSESRQASPASDASGESLTRCSKPHALDQLLLSIVIPFGIRLRSLALDHTSVSGVALTGQVLTARRETLEHLSVRGCKHVSLKYHIVPYLTIYKLQKSVGQRNNAVRIDHLALKSLYAFRCRHHRRRPYLPASLLRRDSDADPTHELIKMCHELGIWTDTAWCPTPGGRCLRRKDYYTGRGNLDGRGEVWVVFDRLWRSGNMLGPSNTTQLNSKPSTAQLWETSESGLDGEPLGCSGTPGEGDGKMVPTHLRRSHRMFVENFACHDCGELIQERCEQCSVRMHCVGCRKILCASCAFAKPLPAKLKAPDETNRKEGENLFWWAPGSTRSPNLMMQEWSNDGLAGSQPNSAITPMINMNWCCLKPMFSGGSGILIGGPGVTGSAAEQIRCAPLPKGYGWEDSEFERIRQHGRPDVPDYKHGEGRDSRLHWLLHGSGSEDNSVCPRNLCQECWQIPDWKDACQACQEPFCFAHDLRGLKMRICGYRDLGLEKAKMEADDALENMRGLVAMRTQELASLTSLPNTLDDDLEVEPRDVFASDDAFENPPTPQPQDEVYALPEILPSSFSESSSTSSSRSSLAKWYGCAAYLCPEFRAIGDHRSRCTAAAKECAGCGVHVCPICLIRDPPCDCSLCAERYHCPNCQRAKPAGSCKKPEEDECKRLEELEAQSRREKELIQAQRVSAEELERLGDEALEGLRDLFTFALADDESQELLTIADDGRHELAVIADDDGSQELAIVANDGNQELDFIADDGSEELVAIVDNGSQIPTTQDLAANATAALVAHFAPLS